MRKPKIRKCPVCKTKFFEKQRGQIYDTVKCWAKANPELASVMETKQQ